VVGRKLANRLNFFNIAQSAKGKNLQVAVL